MKKAVAKREQQRSFQPTLPPTATLLITGWAQDAHSLTPLKEALGREFLCEVISPLELIAEEQSGAGVFQGKKSVQLAPSRYALGLQKRLVSFETPPVLVGWSMGGIIALEVACCYPKLIQKLVLISAGARFSASDDYSIGVSPQEIRGLSMQLRKLNTKAFDLFFQNVLAPENISKGSSEWVRQKRETAEHLNRDLLLFGLNYLLRIDLRSSLRQVITPVLLLHGNRDRVISWKASDYLHEVLPCSKSFLFDGQGHALVETNPTLLADRIRNVLADWW